MSSTEIVYEDKVLRLGVCRNLAMFVWYDAPQTEHVRLASRTAVSLAARHPKNIGFINMIVAGTPRFSDGAREELVKMMRDPRQHARGAAHIIPAVGFGGVATRAFISTAFLVARSPYPHKVFARTRAAATWLAPILSAGHEPWTVEEMVAVRAQVVRKLV